MEILRSWGWFESCDRLSWSVLEGVGQLLKSSSWRMTLAEVTPDPFCTNYIIWQQHFSILNRIGQSESIKRRMFLNELYLEHWILGIIIKENIHKMGQGKPLSQIIITHIHKVTFHSLTNHEMPTLSLVWSSLTIF